MCHIAEWPEVFEWISAASGIALQETLQRKKILPLPDKTPFSVPARLGERGRPVGGLTTYLSNGQLGSATFVKLVSDPHFLCVRVIHDTLTFILGNVYLPLHTRGTDESFVSDFACSLDKLLELYPTDYVLIGGDFNCHLFSEPSTPTQGFEADFRTMVRKLQLLGFQCYPTSETPFTYQFGLTFSTIDYVFSKGFKVTGFEVAEEFAGITNHRPLMIKVCSPVPCLLTSDTDQLTMTQALGGAYYRSAARQQTLISLLETLASETAASPPSTRDGAQRLCDRIENVFALTTKRTARKPHVEKWEYELDPEDVETLAITRLAVLQRLGQ